MPTPAEITRHHDAPAPPGNSSWVEGRGPRTGIAVVEFDPRWPDDFTWLARQIADALGTRALIIEHIGSTSVPGLAAKPVIDIDLTVAVPADEGTWLPPLEAAGFDLVIREPWWYEHRVVVFEVPRCNVHVFGPESPEPVRHRIFRDWLRQHPQDRALYSAAKVAAAAGSNAAGEHVMEYNARKQLVVRAIYDRAFRAAGLL